MFSKVLDNMLSLLNEPHELAAWGVLACSWVHAWTAGSFSGWVYVALTFTGLLTLLGSRRFRGISLSPDGISITGKPADKAVDVGSIVKSVKSELASVVKAQFDRALEAAEPTPVVPVEAVDLKIVEGIGTALEKTIKGKLAERGVETVSEALRLDTIPGLKGDKDVEKRLRTYLETRVLRCAQEGQT